mmetsp:Transcript_99582/g.281802  ORF Transcript_99582/g.281802 Transcript_99582/m.281802 type:complete len:136 (-) Transcript_99582:215-622(-)
MGNAPCCFPGGVPAPDNKQRTVISTLDPCMAKEEVVNDDKMHWHPAQKIPTGAEVAAVPSHDGATTPGDDSKLNSKAVHFGEGEEQPPRAQEQPAPPPRAAGEAAPRSKARKGTGFVFKKDLELVEEDEEDSEEG